MKKTSSPRGSRSTRRQAGLVERLTRALARALPARRLGVAVSGGADSVALLRLLARVAAVPPLELVVFHVDHGLQPDNRAVARWVARLAGRLALPCLDRRLEPPDGGFGRAGGLEAWARNQRLRALAEMAAEAGVPVVALGHHADDQAETVLLRILRGTSLGGLGGMRSRQTLKVAGGSLRLWRPFLSLARAEVRQVLADLGQDWREDASNQDSRMLRNRIRHEVLPLLETIRPGAARHLTALAGDARRAAHALVASVPVATRNTAQGASPARPAVSPPSSSGPRGSSSRAGREFPTASLPEDDFLLAERLRRWLIRRGQGARLGRAALVRLVDLARQNRSGRRVPLGDRVVVRTARGLALIAESGGEPLPSRILRRGEPLVGGKQWFLLAGAARVAGADGCWVPASLAAAGLQVRPRQPGDRFRPAEGVGEKKLGRWLTDRKLPRHERDSLVIVAHGADVLWMPGLARSALTRDRPVRGFVFLGCFPLSPAT